MNSKTQNWMIGATVMVGALVALVLAGSASASMSGDVYGGSGTWTINNPTTLDGQTLSVSGNIDIRNTFTVTNASIVFTVPSASITVYGGAGSLRMGGSGGMVSIGTSSATTYWNFTVQQTAGVVRLENVTLDNVWNGVNVNGGTAASRYFAYVTITDAVNYGFVLTDSSATLLHLSVYLLISTSITEDAYWSNYTYFGGSYWQYSIYGQISNYLTATGTGVLITRGTPWIDGVDVHVPDVSQRIDIQLRGTYQYEYQFYNSYNRGVCGLYDFYNSSYIQHYFYPTVDINGFKSIDSRFAYFEGVRPPSENFSLDLHWTFTGTYSFSYDYCNYYPTQAYTSPDDVYWLNGLYFYTASIVGVFVQNAGLTSLNNLNYAMGHTGISIVCDWGGAQWAIDEFLNYYSAFPVPQVYALWSTETVNTNVAAATTRTDFSLTNSLFTGAGVRIDRNYNYNAPAASGGANNTVFRGDIVIDNVQVLDASAAAIDFRLSAMASNTYNTYAYNARVSNSTLSAGQALSLHLLNHPWLNSNYAATIVIEDNLLENGHFKPGRNLFGVLTINTGGHQSNFGSDTYQADVLIDGNAFINMTGPIVGWDYSNYRFGGGGDLVITDNTFTNISYDAEPAQGGGKGPGATTDAFIKTTADSVTLRGNSFDGFAFEWGILGGESGAMSGNEYIAFSYCALYNYADYGCSWPYKTPTIDISFNSFENVEQDAAGGIYNAFAIAAGRGHITFNNNMINNSTANWVHALLNDYTYYAFPTVDIDIEMNDNTISNQSLRPVSQYTHPYKSGQPLRIERNLYFDSASPLVTWKLGWYSSMGYGGGDYGATFVFSDNVVHDMSLGGEGVARLTGKMTISNNSFDYVSGWAIIAEQMSKIPTLSGNSITHSTDGFWLAPSVVSGLVQTATFTDLTVAVSNTGIRMENGNLLLVRADFGDALTAVDMRNGFAEIYSSKIRVLSGRVSGDASITVYNNVGYEVHWADVTGQDSGVLVQNALVITSTVDHQILSSGRTNNLGRIAPRTVEVWSMVAFGSAQTSSVAVPLSILCFYGGITSVVSLPTLGPGEAVEVFQDYDAYPLLLVDPIIPEITIGKPLAGETVGRADVSVEGYTFERGSGVSTERVRVDGGAWIDIPTDSSTWSVVLPGLAEGRHVLEFEVSDMATNVFSGSMEFFVDLTAPTLTLSSPLEDSTLTNQPVFDIRGHVEPATSAVALNGVTVTVNSRGDFFYNYSLSDGLNILRFTATDAARNLVVVTRQIEFDRYAPFLQVDGPINGLLTNTRSVDVLGRSERDALVTVNGLPAFVNPIDGTFVLPEVSLDDIFDQTENLLVIRAVDRAGNVRFENRTVIVDTKAPEITLEFPSSVAEKIAAEEPVSLSSLNVRGTTDSNDAVITIAGQEVPLTGLSFSRVLVLREGLNLIVVNSRDEAGNTRSVTLRVTRDTVAPTLTLITPTQLSLLTNQSQILVSGFTDAPDGTIYVVHTTSSDTRSDRVLTVAVGVPIEYRFEYMLELDTDGNSHAVDVRASDLAGNFDTVHFDYTAKVNAPALDILGFKESTTDTFVYINGSTDAGIDKVRINGQEFDVVGQYFSVRWNLPIQDGNYTFTISVRDAAGNANTWRGTVQVHATAPPPTPGHTPGILDSPTVQVGLGAGLFGLALAVLVMALARRREVE